MRPGWLRRWSLFGVLLTAVLFSAGYASVGLLVLLGYVVVDAVAMRRTPWRRSPFDGPIVAFVAVFLASGWFSPFRPLAVASAGLAALTILLSFAPLYRELRQDSTFLARLLPWWFAGGVLAAALAIFMFWTTGRPAFTPAIGQNAVGTTLLMALILGIGLYSTDGSRRGLLALGLAVIEVGLLFTYTRGAWLGFAAGALTFLGLNQQRRAFQALALVLLVAFGGLIAAGSEGDHLIRRALDAPSVAINKDRIRLARAGLSILQDRPVLGTGMNTFALVYPKYRTVDAFAVVPPTAHNLYVNMAAEGGLLGLTAFGAIVAFIVIFGWRWHRTVRTREEHVQSASILALMVGTLVNQVFDGTLMSVHLGVALWFLAAIVAASSTHG